MQKGSHTHTCTHRHLHVYVHIHERQSDSDHIEFHRWYLNLVVILLGPNISHPIPSQINSMKTYSRYRHLGLSFSLICLLSPFHFHMKQVGFFPSVICWSNSGFCLAQTKPWYAVSLSSIASTICLCLPQRLPESDGARSQALFLLWKDIQSYKGLPCVVKTKHRVTLIL